ncbi:MAG: energy transducer TonB [Acidobacteriaceae bacterium]|jgi:outer membrane biosynthesis protein TonB
MRRKILTSLVLLPVMAHAQARTSHEPQPSTSSAMLEAEITRPAGMAELAMAAATPAAAASASVATINTSSHAAIREFVQTRVTENFVDAALRKGGTLEYAMSSLPTESSAPRVTRAVEVDLSAQELAEQPAVSNIVVHATVDAYGFPRNLSIVHSAGAVMDKKVLDAVGQYRFTPAMLDNKPVDAAVTISVKIEKP